MKVDFYDLIHSPDDNGWYCEGYTSNSTEVFTTDIFSSASQAQQFIEQKYPKAKLLKKIY